MQVGNLPDRWSLLQVGSHEEEETQDYIQVRIFINSFFLYVHLGYSLNDIVLIQLSPFLGGIPVPGRGIVGKNCSNRSKTTVWSKRGFPIKVSVRTFTVSHTGKTVKRELEVCVPHLFVPFVMFIFVLL